MLKKIFRPLIIVVVLLTLGGELNEVHGHHNGTNIQMALLCNQSDLA